MINWKSNVFPGILGRTCDRPCEPACRRGRVEKEPVAICRLKRVAADYKDDITRPPAEARAQKNGKRIALVGGGPASLTVARDLAPLGYHCTVFDQDPKAGGMMRTQIPKFRLPESVIDEEMRLHPQPRHRVRRRPAHRQPEGAAGRRTTTRSSSAPARRAAASSTFPAARKRPRTSTSASTGCPSVSFGHIDQDRQARHRARRRQHRDGLLPLLAPPRRRGRQGDRALRLRGDEGVALGKGRRHARGHPDPQLPGAEGIHPRQRQADRRHVREGEGRIRRQGPPQPGADRRAGPASSPATTCWSRSARRTPSPGSSATSASSSTSGTCRRSIRRPWRRPIRRCSSAATPRSARRTSSGRWRTATTPRSRSTRCCRGEDITERPLPDVEIISQKMGIHEWSYDNDISLDKRYRVPHARQGDRAEGHQGRGRARLSTSSSRSREAQRCLNCDVQTVFTVAALHRVRRLRRHLPDGLHHLHRRTARRPTCARGCKAPAHEPRPRTSMSPTA